MSTIGLLPINERLVIGINSFIYTIGYGLRESFGNDYYQYMENFRYINLENNHSDIFFEPSYVLLSKLSWAILGSNGYIAVFCVYSLLVVIIFLQAMRNCGILRLGIPLFYSSGFIFFANNQIRQALACALFLWAISRFESGKLRLLYTLPISAFVHISSVVQYSFLLIPKFRLNILVVLVAYSTVLFSSYLLNMLSAAFPIMNFIPLYGEVYSDRLVQTFEESYPGAGLLTIYLSLSYLAITLISIGTKYERVARLFMFGSVLYIVFIKIDLLERIFYPFTFLSTLLIGWGILGRSGSMFRRFLAGIFLFGNTCIVFLQSLLDVSKHGAGPFNHLLWTL